LASAHVFAEEFELSMRFGEGKHAVAAGLMEVADLSEFGDAINGTCPGRATDNEITLFDGTGVGLQDLAVAARAVDLAVARGIAVEVEF